MKTWLVVFILSFFLLTSCQKDDEDDYKSSLPSSVVFTVLPTDLSEMLEFGPIGVIRVVPKAHGGFRLKTFRQEANIPVYAMADGIIFNILKDTRKAGDGFAPPEFNGYEYDDFHLDIAVSQTANIWHGHISRLSDFVLNAAPALKSGRGVENKVSIKVSAGQILGYIGPHPGFDIGMVDYSKEVFLINPSRYYELYRHVQPWTDYLTNELREQVWEINPRIVEPRGGKISYDVENTLSGNWFTEDATSLLQWSKQLIIAKHELYGDRITISDTSPLVDGDGILNDGVEPNIWWIIGNAPKPETTSIASGMVKYEVAPPWRFVVSESPEPYGIVAIQLFGPTSLKFEWFEGASTEGVTGFTDNARVYVR